MPSKDSVRLSVDQLPIGARLSHPINDNERRLLLAAGAPISSSTKKLLRERGILEVLLHPADAEALLGELSGSDQDSSQTQSAASAMHVAEIAEQVSALAANSSLLISSVGPPLRERQTSHGCSMYDEEQRVRLAQQFSASKRLLDNLVQQVLAGSAQDVQALSSNTSQRVAELTHDTDSAITSAAEQAPDPDFSERGIRLAVLGMSLAMEMGWDEPNVREVGLCGLIHDWGMFRLSEKLQDPRNPVLASDWSEMASHPLHTVDMLSPLVNISNEVRLAASQVHENADGSGYPNSLTREKIHPYASILHVADAYITLTAEMRGRPPYFPYDVMVYLLHQVKAKRLEQNVMRALLNVVSLFPIGSHVELSDGSEAQVLRKSSTHYTSPIVKRLGTGVQMRVDGAHETILDLAQSNLKVASPLPTPGRGEVRMDESLMDKILWDGTDG